MAFGETLGRAVLELAVDKTQLKQGLAQAREETQGAVSNIASLAASALGRAVSFAAIVAGVKQATEAFAAQEQAERRLATALQQVGDYSRATQREFGEFAERMQAATGNADDLMINMGALLLNLGVLPHELQRAASAAADLSAGLGMDLRTAMMLVGRAASGNIEMFGRHGVVFDEARIKVGGFGAVLDELEARFGGQAQKNMETFEGQLKGLKNAFSDLLEEIGRPFVTGGSKSVLAGVTGFFNMLSSGLKGIHEESKKAGEAFGKMVVDFLELAPATEAVWASFSEGLKGLEERSEKSRREVKLSADVQEGYNALIKSEREELEKLLREKSVASFVLAGEERQKKLLTEAVRRSKEAIAQEGEALRAMSNAAASARFEGAENEKLLRSEFALRGVIAEGLQRQAEEQEKLTQAMRDSAEKLLEQEKEWEEFREDLDGMVDGSQRLAKAFEVLNPPQTFVQGWSEAFQKWRDEVEDAGKTGERAFKGFQGALSAGFSDVIFAGARGKLGELADAVDNFGKRVLRSMADIAADKIAKELLSAAGSLAGGLAGGLQKVLGLAEGALVTKPTAAVLAEAGPELVIPLDAAGKFLQAAIVDAAKTGAISDVALSAGIPEGSQAAMAGAATAAGAATFAALLALAEAGSNALFGRPGPIETLGKLVLTGTRGPGLLQQGLGALGIGAFRGGVSPGEHGAGNVWQIAQMLESASENFGDLGVGLQRLIEATGGDPGSAWGFLKGLTAGMPRISQIEGGLFGLPSAGDAEGRYYTGDAMRMVHQGEHTLNVDSEPSVRALREGLRPVIRELFDEIGSGRGAGSGRQAVVVQLVLNGRAIQEISREVDMANERRPRTAKPPRPLWSGV